MESLVTLTNFILFGFVASAVWAPLLIWLLYKLNIVSQHRLMDNKMNAEFMRIHGHKVPTPRSGGLIISIPILLIVLFIVPASPLRNLFLIGWTSFLAYGLVDDLLVSGRKVSDAFRLFQETFAWRIGKLLLLVGIAGLTVYLAQAGLGINELQIVPGVNLPINLVTIPILAIGIFAALFGIEITDGADALVTGNFMINYAVLIVIAILTGHGELLPYLGLLVGASMVYLYFNINPARVFMGGTGTLPIAFAMLLITLVTNTLPVFIIMGMVYWLEAGSSIIQIIAIRFFKRKVFRIAPLHHHLEASGWPETKVVQRLWLLAGVFGLLALWVFAHIS